MTYTGPERRKRRKAQPASEPTCPTCGSDDPQFHVRRCGDGHGPWQCDETCLCKDSFHTAPIVPARAGKIGGPHSHSAGRTTEDGLGASDSSSHQGADSQDSLASADRKSLAAMSSDGTRRPDGSDSAAKGNEVPGPGDMQGVSENPSSPAICSRAPLLDGTLETIYQLRDWIRWAGVPGGQLPPQAEADTAITDLLGNLTALESELGEAQARIETDRRELEEARGDVRRWAETGQELDAELQRRRVETRQAKEDAFRMSAAYIEMSGKRDAIAAENAKLRDELGEARGAVETHLKQFREARRQVEELRVELAKLREQAPRFEVGERVLSRSDENARGVIYEKRLVVRWTSECGEVDQVVNESDLLPADEGKEER